MTKPTDGQPYMTNMTYFSGHFFNLACRMAVEAPSRGLSAVSGSVIFAVSALEAFLSERIEDARIHEPNFREVGESLLDTKGLSSNDSWLFFQRLLCGRTFDSGAEPHQSFKSLVDLRNVLVHRASRHRRYDEFPSRSVEQLSSKFAFTPRNQGLTWDMQVLNTNCAWWACKTAAAMQTKHYEIVGTPAPGDSGWSRAIDSLKHQGAGA